MDADKKIQILASWDDGDTLDLGLADLLLKYEIPSVFYIPQNCGLNSHQIKMIAGQNVSCLTCKKAQTLFDFGAHTVSHPEDLKLLSDEEIRKEVLDSKVWLEGIIGRPVTRFAYPSGRYNERVKEIVKECGLLEARTASGLNIAFPKDPFETRPTIHVRPDKEYYEGKVWVEWAHELFDRVINEGGRFELWGHSWELFEYHQEDFLEDFLSYMNERMRLIKYPRRI